MTRRIGLRPANAADEQSLLEWRNDAETRRWSLQAVEIDAAAHSRWLRAKLDAPETTRIYIAEVDGLPVGQARLDRREAETGEISVGLDGSARGKGLGVELIRAASLQGIADLRLTEVVAIIKVGNDPSARAFARAGYELVDRANHAGTDVWVYRLYADQTR